MTNDDTKRLAEIHEWARRNVDYLDPGHETLFLLRLLADAQAERDRCREAKVIEIKQRQKAEAERDAAMRVVEAARQFESDLSSDCDGPHRDELRAALSEWKPERALIERDAIMRVVEAARAYRGAEQDGTPRLWRGKVLHELAATLDDALAAVDNGDHDDPK